MEQAALVLLQQSLADVFQEANPGDQLINSWRQALFPLQLLRENSLV